MMMRLINLNIIYPCRAALAAALVLLCARYAGAGEESSNEMATAEEFFHKGAQPYIFGDDQIARSAAETGLTIYPDDPKLNALILLLQEQREPPPQYDQAEEDPDNDEDDPERDDEQIEDPDTEADPDEDDPQADPVPADDVPDDQQRPLEDDEALDPGKMTAEDADMILDAKLQEEEAYRDKTRLRLGPRVPVAKDW